MGIVAVGRWRECGSIATWDEVASNDSRGGDRGARHIDTAANCSATLSCAQSGYKRTRRDPSDEAPTRTARSGCLKRFAYLLTRWMSDSPSFRPPSSDQATPASGVAREPPIARDASYKYRQRRNLFATLVAVMWFSTACSKEAVRVGTAEPNIDPGSCGPLGDAPHEVADFTPFLDEGVWANGDSLFFFRGAPTLDPISEPAKVVRFRWPAGPESVLASVPVPGAAVAGGDALYWVNGPSVLWQADLEDGQSRVLDRRGGLQETRMAATASGAVAFVRQYRAEGRLLSALWRSLPARKPEALALLEGAILDIFLTRDATLLVGAPLSPASGRRLFRFGALERLDPTPEVERFSGRLAAPLSASPPAVAAFDGSNVYYVAAAPGDVRGRFQILASSLADNQSTVLAWSQEKQPDSRARKPSSLILRGEDLVWIESDEGDRDCSLCAQPTDPYWWVSHQSIRSVPKLGGELRLHWSSDARVARASTTRPKTFSR